MNNRLVFIVGVIVLVVGVFAVFAVSANAKGLNLLCFGKPNIIITLKNEADVSLSKEVISKIPQIKIVNIKYRDEEWSRMVNKMDLPNMENPFKNEIFIKTNKNANTDDIFAQLKEMSFVENVQFVSDTK